MRKTALITGASNGIGWELARKFAQENHNLVLVARNKVRLDELKTELEATYKILVYTIGKDLSLSNSALAVYEEIAHHNIQIDYLINNAGFGGFGSYDETDWLKEEQMIQLNITTLAYFTKLYLKEMVQRGDGKIMNVASTAAFQAGPLMAVYFATKAFVLSFTEAINNEVKNKGVTLTSLCPGATESGFKAAAEMSESRLFKGRKLPPAKEVAEYGYDAMMSGKTVAIHGMLNRIMANSLRFIPRSWAVMTTRKIMENKK